MTAFITPVDIGNRALQQCGAKRMGLAGFNEVSVNASEVRSCYDKLRRAELQRNTWKFAIKETVLRAIDSNAMLLTPSLWAPGTVYYRGSIVADINNSLWISNIPNNIGNDPLLTTYWEPYYGPLAVPLYDASGTTAYFSGELVYTAPGDGTYRVYLSLVSGNSDVPGTATQWSSTVTYFKNQTATFNNIAYQSLIDLNINNEPDLSPVAWVSTTTYSSGQRVCGSNGYIYQSVTNSNINNNPISDNGVNWTNTGVLCPWTTSFVGGTGSLNWVEIGGPEFPSGVALSTLNMIWPVGAGPLSQSNTRNVFRLPANFLRRAPMDSKAGTLSTLGAPGNLNIDDWEFKGSYFTSWSSFPVIFPFVSDWADVTSFDDMFCEGLAARIGFEICPKVTQSTAKRNEIGQAYNRFMNEARMSNAILIGAEEPPLDDWIACRL